MLDLGTLDNQSVEDVTRLTTPASGSFPQILE